MVEVVVGELELLALVGVVVGGVVGVGVVVVVVVVGVIVGAVVLTGSVVVVGALARCCWRL